MAPHIPPPPSGRTLAIFHTAETSGPSMALRNGLAWLAGGGPVTAVVPGPGSVADTYGEFADTVELGYRRLTVPRGPVAIATGVARLVRDVRMFRAAIRRVRPTLVVSSSASALPTVVLAASAERVPLLVYTGEFAPLRPGLGRAAGAGVVRRLTARRAAAVIGCADVIARQYSGSRARVFTMYAPIGRHYADGDGDAVRARYGIAPDAPCITAIGAISAGRGQDTFVRALRIVRDRLPDVQGLLVGASLPERPDRRYEKEVTALIRDLGLEDAIAITGHMAQVADAYAASSVAVNPARIREGARRVMLEALAAGRPVVATRVGAIPEILRDGEDAILIPPDDPDALAQACLGLLEDETAARALAERGRERVRKDFSEERALGRFAEVVTAVTGREAVRAPAAEAPAWA